MTPSKKVVLDANILIRAVFGRRVYDLMRKYEDTFEFHSPDTCIREVRKHLTVIAARRQFPPERAEMILEEIGRGLVQVVDHGLYDEFEEQARSRIAKRDVNDWPVVATALLLQAPIWTEDQDFFGAGIATWTSDRIELYLRGS